MDVIIMNCLVNTIKTVKPASKNVFFLFLYRMMKIRVDKKNVAVSGRKLNNGTPNIAKKVAELMIMQKNMRILLFGAKSLMISHKFITVIANNSRFTR